MAKEKKTGNPAKGNSEFDELSSLALEAKGIEDVERAKTGASNSFIAIAQGKTSMLEPTDAAYIKGLKLFEFAIGSKKLRLGKSLDVTILAVCKVYGEVVPKGSEGNATDMDKVVKFWMPEDAENYPVDGIFDRPIPGGNVLRPQHWVFVYLHDHPEIEDAVFGFKSVGNGIWNETAKLLKKESEACTELRFTVTTQAKKDDKHNSTNYYPKFELAKRNYAFVDGKVKTLPGGLDKDELLTVLTRSRDILKDYASMKIVSKQLALPGLGTFQGKALPGSKAASYTDDKDETPKF